MEIKKDEKGIIYGVYPKSSDKGFIDYMEKINELDWEQRRYEIAKAMLPAIYLDDGNAERADKSNMGFEYKTAQNCAKDAVDFADALIEELKKKRYTNE